MDYNHYINKSFLDAKSAIDNAIDNKVLIKKIEEVAIKITNCFNNEGRVFSCGNGGSMSDAMHFAEELTGRFKKNRRALPACAISDPGHLSCVANDFGYENVFSRYLEAHANKGDILLAITTSGSSKNIIEALKYTKEKNIYSVLLTGKENTPAGYLASLEIITPSNHTERIQELHIKVIHIIIELIERSLFPENYTD